MNSTRLTRVQWAVRGVLVLGVAVSTTANILHAQPNIIAQCIAAWPPLALFVTVELVSRVPINRRALGVVRVLATTIIAGIAAWVSYWHMVGVVSRYGEVGSVPYMLPLSVDGLIVVASASLVELTGIARRPAQGVTATPPAKEQAQQHGLIRQTLPSQDSESSASGLPSPKPEPKDRTFGRPEPEEADDNIEDGFAEPGPPSASDESQDNGAVELSPELVPLLPAARAARDDLLNAGSTLSRDALAAQLRHNGTPIRNTKVSELLSALKTEGAGIDLRRKESV